MAKTCSNCGHSGLKSLAPSLYHYKISGLDNVYLKGGVTEFICPECGTKSTSIRNLPGLHKAIAANIALAKRRLSGSELRFLREQIAFSAEEFAKLVEYTEDSVRKVESGAQTPKGAYEVVLRIAVLKEIKSPSYDLHSLAEPKKYQIEELKFVNKDLEWEIAA